MSTMTLTEFARERETLKREVREAVTAIVHDFEVRTGTRVDGVSVRKRYMSLQLVGDSHNRLVEDGTPDVDVEIVLP